MFNTLTPDEVRALDADDLKLYRHHLEYETAKLSPLDTACWLSPETVRTAHLEYINDRIVALFEYRLYHHRGPGPEARWFYRLEEDGNATEVDSPFDFPDDIYETWGEHPDDPTDRVVFNLGIAVPPRHGKSWIVTEHLPLWIWMRWPDMHIGFGTYSDDFAAKWGKKLRTRLNENSQRLGLTLPGKDRQDSQHLYFRETKGEMYLVGTGGSMTGRGWQAGIIDDPIKDAAEAASAATRESKADWYESPFDTRRPYAEFFPIAVHIMMFTRWHEDDPAGRFIYDDDKSVNDHWHMIRLPALAMEDDPLDRKPGEALWPRVITAKELLRRQARDPLWFGAMYQGWPTMGDKGMFGQWSDYDLVDGQYTYKEDGVVYSVPEGDCVRFATMDTAYTKNTWSDYTVFAVWDYSRDNQRGFVRHVERIRLESVNLAEFLRIQWRKWEPTFVGVEDVSSGKELLQELRKQAEIIYRPLQPDRDKVARALGYAQAARLGLYKLPTKGAWVAEYREEHSLFPTAGKHDDMVDSGSYAHWVIQRFPKLIADANERFIVDTSIEGRVKRHMDKLDRSALRKNKSRGGANRALQGRIGM